MTTFTERLLDCSLVTDMISEHAINIAKSVFAELDIDPETDDGCDFDEFRYHTLEPNLTNALTSAIDGVVENFPTDGDSYRADLGCLI